MAEEIMSVEVAQGQIDKFIEHYDIDFDDMDDKEKEAWNKSAKIIMKYMRRGLVSIEKDGDGLKVIQRTKLNKTEIIYKEITNGDKEFAQECVEKSGSLSAAYSLMAQLASQQKVIITGLKKGADSHIVENLAILFMLG